MKKLLLSVVFIFGIYTISGVYAETSTVELEYLEVPNYPQENKEINPIVLGKFKIKNTSSQLIPITSIIFTNKGNLSLKKLSNIVLVSDDGIYEELESELENIYKFTRTFNLEAGQTKIFEIKASAVGIEAGNFVKIDVEFDQNDISTTVKGDSAILAPKKSELRIIGDEMGNYDIMENQKNLPLLAFHIQSDELTLIPTLKLFLDNTAESDVNALKNSFVNFKLFDNERQIFIHPTGDITTEGLSFAVNSDVWVNGNNYFALFTDIGTNFVLDTSIRFRLDELLSIKDAKFLTTKGDVEKDNIEFTNIIGSKVTLKEEVNVIEEIPDLPSGISLIEENTEEEIDLIPDEIANPPSSSGETVEIIDNSNKEAEKELEEFTKEIVERIEKKKVYLRDKGVIENDIIVDEEDLSLIDLDSLEFFPDTDPNSLEGIAAAYLRSLGIIGGYPDGEFKGNRKVNRAEITKFLLLGSDKVIEETTEGSIFPDVQVGSWYEKYVVTANIMNIVNGYPDGTFQPSKNVNTVEFLKMLTNSFNLEKNLVYMFEDVKENQWFAQFVGNVEKYNLFPRRSVTELEPAKEMTRNEVAVAIYQILLDRLK